MGRRRKLFLGTEPIGGKDMKSRRKARFVTSQYHSIRNELTAIEKDVAILPSDKDSQRRVLNDKLEAIGGVDKYQQASIISTSHFKTSRWVVTILEQLGRRKTVESDRSAALEAHASTATSSRIPANKLSTLEVGAINVQLQQCPWLKVRAIDVNSQHPSIEEIDFFLVPPLEDFDAVVCSMVVNCVTEPAMRGEMLARLYAHIKPVTGVLFLVLPLRCINSRHVGSAKFDSLLTGMGFSHLIEKRLTPRLVFYVLGRDIETPPAPSHPSISPAETKMGSSKDSKENKDSDKSDKKQNKKQKCSDDRAISDPWRSLVQSSIFRNMKQSTLDYFCRDCSAVPPVEFCLSMQSVVTP